MDNATEYSSCSSLSMNLEEVLKDFKNPDHEKIQKLRDKYWEVSEKLKLMSVENGEGGCNLDELTAEIASINEIAFQPGKKKNAHTPANEGNMDARVLKEISRLAKANIEKTQASPLTFKPAEYAKLLEKFSGTGQPLSELFEGDLTHLNKMAKGMSCLYRTSYGLEPLYGALEWEPPAKPAREAPRKRDDLKGCVKKTVREVQTSSTGEENQTVEIQRILRVLKLRVNENKNAPINFLEFVIDPTCFSTTVQNIFHTSFLIRDGMAKFSFDKYKIPYISHVVEGRKGSLHAAESNHQSVVDMSLKIWREAIKVLEIEEAMIPNISRNNKRPSQASQLHSL